MKVIVIGNSGSGKSTHARTLATMRGHMPTTAPCTTHFLARKLNMPFDQGGHHAYSAACHVDDRCHRLQRRR